MAARSGVSRSRWPVPFRAARVSRRPWTRQISLITRALAAYHKAECSQARLQVRSNNTEALRLYTQLGFTSSGRDYAILQASMT